MKSFDLVIDFGLLVVVLVGASGLLASGMCLISYIVYWKGCNMYYLWNLYMTMNVLIIVFGVCGIVTSLIEHDDPDALFDFLLGVVFLGYGAVSIYFAVKG